MSAKDEAAEAAAAAAEAVLAERQWPVTIELREPIDFGEKNPQHITMLTFRRGRMGDLKGMATEDISSIDKLLVIASRMCGQPVAALQMLCDDDGGKVIDIAMGFFGRSLLGGKTR